MDVDAARPASPELYPTLFRQYIQHSTQAALEALRSAGPRLAAEQREQSLHTLEFALNLPAVWTEARSLLISLAPRLDQAGLRQDAALFIRRGIEQCQAQEDAAGQAELEVQLGGLELTAGRMEQARELYQASAARFAALGDRHNQARALNNWAYLDFLQQHSASAAGLVQQAMDLAAPEESETTYGQFVLGCLAIERRAWAEALVLFQQALTGWQHHDQPVLAARGLVNLGTAQRGLGHFDAAIDSFSQAIARLEELGDPVNQALARLNLGNLHWARGEPQQALALFQQAEPIFRQTGDDLRLARVNNSLGVVHLQLGQLEPARANLESSIVLSRQAGDRRLAANALDTLGELHLRLGEPAAALARHDQALAELGHLAEQPGYENLVAEIQRHRQEALAAQSPP